jgi:type 1 glutamine amidotransferase
LAKFPGTWKTPKGELYQVVAKSDQCVPLATAKSKETKNDEVCVWTNTYGKGRVFGTTIGHYNEELADPVFLDMLTRGLLWACDKPVDSYLKPFDPARTKFRWEQSTETKEPPKAGK